MKRGIRSLQLLLIAWIVFAGPFETAPPALAGPMPDLLVASWGTNQILRYDGQTGSFEGVFASGGDLFRTEFMTVGPDGDLYVSNVRPCCDFQRQVLRYDGETGEFLGVFASQGLNSPVGLDFGPDGNLYVSSAPSAVSSGKIQKYHGQTGAFLGTFVQYPSTTTNAVDLQFGPDGDLYASVGFGLSSTGIRRYDGQTGSLLGLFASTTAPRFVFGPDGDLYGSLGNRVDRFDASSGELIGTFTTGGPEIFSTGLTFGQDGHLYVSNVLNHNVLRYDGTTGEFLGEFSVDAGLSYPTAIVFIPEPSTLACFLIGLCILPVFRRLRGAAIGNVAHFNHRFSLVVLATLLLLPTWPSAVIGATVQDLLVASSGTNQILRYDGQTGAFEGVFASGGDLFQTQFMTVGPDGDLYVSNRRPCCDFQRQVLRYDGETGEFLGVFASQSLNFPLGLDFGPDGNLYVSSAPTAVSSGMIQKYHGQTGAFLGTFVQYPTTLINAVDLQFGSDGDLFASVGGGLSSTGIRRYDGQTGSPLGVFATTSAPRFVFGPDGDLYGSLGERVDRYDGETGMLVGTFASGGGLTDSRGLIFGPDGSLYVSNGVGHNVLRYDGETGEFLGEFAAGRGLSYPTAIVFIPEPSTLACFLIGMTLVMRIRMR